MRSILGENGAGKSTLANVSNVYLEDVLLYILLFFDSVFSTKSTGQLRLHRVDAPTSKELNALVGTTSERVARYLERRGAPG